MPRKMTAYKKPEGPLPVTRDRLPANYPIAGIPVLRRARSLLKNAGVVMLGDAVTKTKEDLLNINGIGEKTAVILLHLLKQNGLSRRTH